MKNRELTNLMYELYDREFDIEEIYEVIEALRDLREKNCIKNRIAIKYGEHVDTVERWRGYEKESYINCKAIFEKYKLRQQPYKII